MRTLVEQRRETQRQELERRVGFDRRVRFERALADHKLEQRRAERRDLRQHQIDCAMVAHWMSRFDAARRQRGAH